MNSYQGNNSFTPTVASATVAPTATAAPTSAQYYGVDLSKLGTDPFSASLKNNLITQGDKSYLTASDYDYYNSLMSNLGKSRIGYYGANQFFDPYDSGSVKLGSDQLNSNLSTRLNIGGTDYEYMPYEMAARLQGEITPEGMKRAIASQATANDKLFKSGKVVNFSDQALLDAIRGDLNYTSADGYSRTPTLDELGMGYLFTPEELYGKKAVGNPFEAAKYGMTKAMAGMDPTRARGPWVGVQANAEKYLQENPLAPEYIPGKAGLIGSGTRPATVFKGNDPSARTGAIPTSGPLKSNINDNVLNTGRKKHDVSNLAGSWMLRNYDETGKPLNLLSGIDSLPSKIGTVLDPIQSGKWVTQSPTDKKLFGSYDPATRKWNTGAYDTWVEKKGGGGFFGGLTSLFDAVAPILAFTPLAPIAAGWQMGRGIGSGNLGQAVMGGLGVYGSMTGGLGNLNSSVGNFANNNVLGNILTSKDAIGALGSGLINAGGTALSGGSLKDVIGSGLGSGLGAYAGSLVNGATKGMNPYLSAGLSGAANNTIRSLGMGTNPLTGALAGALGGGLGAYGGTLGNQLGGKFGAGFGEALGKGIANSVVYGKNSPQQLAINALSGGASKYFAKPATTTKA